MVSLILFGVSVTLLPFTVFGFDGQSSKWIGYDSFTYRGIDKGYEKISPGSGNYYNPILAGFYPDPSICRVGRDYYLINSTFAYYPGIPIFHSRDLVNWKQIGHVIHRPEQLRYQGLGVSRGIFAPAITWHEGVFYVVCTMVDGGGNFVVTSTDPAGPWSDPVYFTFEGIDPSLFFDEDGRAWMVNNGAPESPPIYNGHRAIWMQEFDPGTKKMIGPRKVIVDGGVDITAKPIWIEGPHIYQYNGMYYLFCAEGGTGPEHSEVVFRSQKVDGPYAPWEKNPILTQRDLDPNASGAVTCTGHADFVVGPDGKWWSVFLGVRPYDGEASPMGRETFMLPVTWTDDHWPVILPKGERVPLTVNSPDNTPVVRSEKFPMSGNFTWKEEFDGDELSPLWVMLREPKESWYELDSSKGHLRIAPRRKLLTGKDNPSYLARRIQNASFTVTALLEVPEVSGISAGLALFQNEDYHYFLAVRKDGGKTCIYLEQVKGGKVRELGTVQLPDMDKIRLGIDAEDSKCSFKYMDTKESWTPLVENADARMLTTAVAGGFVGATVGPYVRIDD